ncbi:MAG TPA: DUF177 domain-containing protein [Actinomycetota bacterium]|nr:DUF177 domain-containing protein [Actinomycetota bacterium]
MDAVDVGDLLGSPGASRRVRREEPLEGLATELAEVPADDPVRIELLLESVVEGIVASGPVSGRMRFRCARCLKGFSEAFSVEVSELFAVDRTPDDEETYPVREGTIDLEPMVRDVVVLSMPFSPLCRDDCLGLCERCGGDRNAGECSCEPVVDARWAPLAGLDLD